MEKKGRHILYFIFCLTVFYCPKGFAQQAPQYTQFFFQQLAFNPAYVGSSNDIVIDAGLRGQWIGLPEQPFSQNIGIHLPVPLLSSGIGLQVSNDMLGPNRHTSAYLAYAWKWKINRSTALSIGIQGGIIQQAWKGGELITPFGEYDGTINHNDAILPTSTVGSLVPDGAAGIYFNTSHLEIGLAAQHLLEPKASFQIEDQQLDYQYKRHFLAYGAYDFSIGNTIILQPSLLIKSDLVNLQAELHALATINENILAGVGFRGWQPNSFDAVTFLAGIHLTNYLRLSYSYDWNISSLQKTNTGSHELVIRYTIKNVLPSGKGKARYNPRHL